MESWHVPLPLGWRQSQLHFLRQRLHLHEQPIMKKQMNNYDRGETIAEQATDCFSREET